MDWQKDKVPINKGSELIYNCIINSIQNNSGAIIGRHGSTELTLIMYYEQNKTVTPSQIKMLERYSGIFNYTNDWLSSYKEATGLSDIFAGGWYSPLANEELLYLAKYKMPIIPLRSLEPYYADQSWLRALEGQRVTVVSSFADTMREQITKPIWDTFPKANWNFVRSYYCPSIAQGKCEWPNGVDSWSKAVDYLESEVLKTDPRIVLIGCGGLAMPLALKLKKKGIITVVLGGAIQILFGIKRHRWESHPVISEFFNDSWVFPSDDEIPNAAEKIEHGCYW